MTAVLAEARGDCEARQAFSPSTAAKAGKRRVAELGNDLSDRSVRPRLFFPTRES
jgi:hypothetical protein